MPQQVDLVSVILTVVVAGVVSFVGLLVMDSVVQNMGDTHEFESAEESLINAIDDFFGILGVVFTVIVLATILVYLYALRGR